MNDDIICSCHHKMVKCGETTDTSLGKSTQRFKYVCPHCGNVAFLDPDKWDL
jgi:predicted RNA-binding Zn-ribbon protein involved in translation (DUF1610 family)